MKGGNSKDDGALSSLPIPSPIAKWQQWQQCKQQCVMTTVAAVRTMVPWHHWLFLACSGDGVDGSSMDDSAGQQWL